MTTQTRQVLDALLEHASTAKELYGLQIVRSTGLAPGTIYPILARLESHGWVTVRTEPGGTAQAEGRPARRYYTLTTEGRARAAHSLQNALRGPLSHSTRVREARS